MVRPVLLDSSVLFPNVLRDTLLTLAEHDLYEPQWSAEILAEVRRNVVAERSIPESAIDRTLALMSALRVRDRRGLGTARRPAAPARPG